MNQINESTARPRRSSGRGVHELIVEEDLVRKLAKGKPCA